MPSTLPPIITKCEQCPGFKSFPGRIIITFKQYDAYNMVSVASLSYLNNMMLQHIQFLF